MPTDQPKMSAAEFARRLLPWVATEGATVLVADAAQAAEFLDALEAAGPKYPITAFLSSTGTTVHLTPIREDLQRGSVERHNVEVGLKWFAGAKAAGRFTRVLRPA